MLKRFLTFSTLLGLIKTTANKESMAASDLVVPKNSSTAPDHLNTELYSFYFTVNGIIGCSLCVIGLLGNLASVIVLSSMYRKNRTSTNIFLIIMSAADLIVLAIYLIYGITCIVTPQRPIIDVQDVVNHTDTFTIFIYYVWYFPANIFMTVSNWSTVSVMTFRFIAVHFPLKASQWCSTTRAKLVVLVVVTLSVLLVVPEFLTIKIVANEYTGFNFNDTHLFDSKSFNHIYYSVAETFNSILPFVVCTVLATLLLRALRHKDKRLSRQDSIQMSHRRQYEQRKISIMLLGITFWFMICTCPAFICRMSRYLITSNITAKQSWIKFRGVSDMFLLLNHTANFILYAVTNHSYRQHFVDLILCRDRKAIDRQTSVARNLSQSQIMSAVSTAYRYTSVKGSAN